MRCGVATVFRFIDGSCPMMLKNQSNGMTSVYNGITYFRHLPYIRVRPSRTVHYRHLPRVSNIVPIIVTKVGQWNRFILKVPVTADIQKATTNSFKWNSCVRNNNDESATVFDGTFSQDCINQYSVVGRTFLFAENHRGKRYCLIIIDRYTRWP